MTSKYKIAEQVLLLLKGGNIKAATSIEMEDIMEAVGQSINTHFKQEHLSVNMPSGETIPEGCMLTYYDGIVPVQYKTVSKITLPATPVALPRNMGIFHVSRTADIDNGFIPAQNGQLALIKGERLISGVLGQVVYTPYGNDLVFNVDLTTEVGVTIIVGLVVMDISKYDDYDLLPIPADMEGLVAKECFQLFASQMPGSKIVDPSSERSPQTQQQ
jgi:hypothetical protein